MPLGIIDAYVKGIQDGERIVGFDFDGFGVTWERRNGTHKLSGTLLPGDQSVSLERLVLRYNRRSKVRPARPAATRGGEAYLAVR